MTALSLGFIPLTDCAPLVVAEEKGFFAREGLSVSLQREASWATVRDKVAVGALDGAHMLAPMVLAATAGVSGPATAMIAPLALAVNGAAFTLARPVAEALGLDAWTPTATAAALARLIAMRAGRGEPVLTFAVVFPFSMHNYALRYWLAQAGVDPDRDVRLVVTPPPRMVEQLREGAVDGVCVGAPWNSVAVDEGLGRIAFRSSQFWPAGPDKVLGVTEAFADRDPARLRALLRALVGAQIWADAAQNRAELADLLARPAYVGAAPEAIAKGLEHELVFHAGGAALPRLQHARWFLGQMRRWAQIDDSVDQAALAARVYRPDLAGEALPESAASEAQEPGPLFDGQAFDAGLNA